MVSLERPRTVRRVVHHGDAIAWLSAQATLAGASVITSLPDVSELPGLELEGWRAWFTGAARLILERLDEEGVAIFFQSDIRQGGVWVDKGALVARAADEVGTPLLFHKIVCRLPAGTPTFGRASYAHLLAFGRRPKKPVRGSPDVLPDGGFRPGRKAMGALACLEACRFVERETPTRTIIDPFCGWGTVLAVANALGLDAVGVDLSARMCRRARTLELALDALASPRAPGVEEAE